jgi:peptidoglycan hydrolase-like amidase
MKIILSSKKHNYLAKVSIFLITVAFIAGMLSCGSPSGSSCSCGCGGSDGGGSDGGDDDGGSDGCSDGGGSDDGDDGGDDGGGYNLPLTIRVLMDDGSVEIMNLEEYVKGVVAAEMYSDWPIEALKAQAVAARTFAVNNTHHDHTNVDVCTDHNCCQAWNGPPYDATIVDSVTSTCNEVITYNGTIITEALFFSHCNGHTRNSEEYNGWDYVAYLRGVSCGCADEYGWTDYNGHGVGMCQYGAKIMAEQGFSYVDILKHYYSGITIALANTLLGARL